MKEQTAIDTSRYTLMLRISHDTFTYVYYKPAEDDSMQHYTTTLQAGESLIDAVEQIVYSHEILLQPFKRVYVVIDSTHFTFVPDELATERDKSAYYRALFPDDADHCVVACRLPHTGAVLLSGVADRLVSFVQRTFDRPTLLHPLVALCEYFYLKSRIGNQRKMYVHLNKGRVDIVCLGREGLLMANTMNYRHSNDAGYHILNVWRQLGLDQRVDEVHIVGDIEVRRELSALLRNYIHTVIPVIFPSHSLVLGSDVMQIPFDLTALSLCEL